MASALYPEGVDAILSGSIDFTSDDIRAALVDTGTYTYSAAHDFYDDLSGVVGTPVQLTSPTVTAGVFDAADTVISSVTGATVEAIVLYKYNATASLAQLLAYIDGISVTPNGNDITITWDSGANKIFKVG